MGSLNFDLIATVSRFPNPGESLIGREFYTSSGGKGGNQAVAASRLGAEAFMVGRVGSDGVVLVTGSMFLVGQIRNMFYPKREMLEKASVWAGTKRTK